MSNVYLNRINIMDRDSGFLSRAIMKLHMELNFT